MKTCPFCAEEIQDAAIVCKHCGRDLRPAPPPVPAPVIYAQLPPATKTNGLAIASLVLGIVWLWFVGSILALIFGYAAKGQIERSEGRETGRGLAVAGIVLGWIGVAFIILVLVAIPLMRHQANDTFNSINSNMP